MKVAFSNWENRIAPLFDTAEEILLVELEGDKVLNESLEKISGEFPLQRALRLEELGVEVLVCGAISRPMQRALLSYKVELYSFVAGELHKVLQGWISDRLRSDSFAMPGCCRGGRGMGGGRGRGMGGGRGRGMGGRAGAAGRGGFFAEEDLLMGCLCPSCGHREPHQRGFPCVQKKCIHCGTALIRE